jgi:hypothetical protein
MALHLMENTRLSCVWPAGEGCAPLVSFVKRNGTAQHVLAVVTAHPIDPAQLEARALDTTSHNPQSTVASCTACTPCFPVSPSTPPCTHLAPLPLCHELCEGCGAIDGQHDTLAGLCGVEQLVQALVQHLMVRIKVAR